MNNFFINLKKVINNPAIIYVLSRYGTYLIQFINSLFIAVYLGPYYLGIWGFINLVIGYIGQLNMGISQSVNVTISVNKDKENYVNKIIGNGLSMIVMLSVLVILFLITVKLGIIKIGDKYSFNDFIIPVMIISVLTHINGLFSNVFRVFGKIHAIAINQSLFPVIVFFLIPFFREEKLLWAMLLANVAAFIFSFILYIIQNPIKIKPIIDLQIFQLILKKGWYLFVYNSSFLLIMLTTNTFISSNYQVREFGFYTFSYSLANVVLLLLNSISFLIFPKLLNRFATATNEQIYSILSNVRTAYISLSHLLIHFVIMMFPVFLLFFPAYGSSASVFKFTALTVVLYTNSFGYQGLLLARGKEKLIGNVAFSALLLNIVLSGIFVFVFRVRFDYVVLATMITYFLYVIISSIYGRKEMGLDFDLFSTLKDIYPWRMMLPFFISLSFALFNLSEIYFVIPFLLYLALNFGDILKIKQITMNVVRNPNFVNI